MASAKKRTRTIDPWKTKKWFPIYGPKYMRGSFIGETPASEVEKIFGREVTLSLAAITGEMKKQNVNLTFKITSMEGSNAITEIKKFELTSSYIKRQVRKGRDRVDDVFRLKTSDKKEVILKTFIVTKNKVNNSKKTLLRKLSKQEIREYVSKITYSELVQDLVSFKLQKTIGQSLRKVSPLKNSDIRVMSLVEEKGTASKEAGSDIDAEKFQEATAEDSDEESEEQPEEADEEKPELKEKKKEAPAEKKARKKSSKDSQ